MKYVNSIVILLTLVLVAGCMAPHEHSGGCCGGDPGYGEQPPSGPGSGPTNPPPASASYRCPMDGGTRTSPGPCPICGMTLDERHRVR
jgi:hypothetical protein